MIFWDAIIFMHITPVLTPKVEPPRDCRRLPVLKESDKFGTVYSIAIEAMSFIKCHLSQFLLEEFL